MSRTSMLTRAATMAALIAILALAGCTAPASSDTPVTAPVVEETTAADEGAAAPQEQPVELLTVGPASVPTRIGDYELFAEGDNRLRDSGCSGQMGWPRTWDEEDLGLGLLWSVTVSYSSVLSSFPADCEGIDERTLSLHVSSFPDEAAAAAELSNHVTTNGAMYEELEPGVFCAQWANPRCMTNVGAIRYDGFLLSGPDAGSEDLSELAALLSQLSS